jgi:hypothetical protein
LNRNALNMKTSLRPVLLCALLSSAASGPAEARPFVFERTWNELNATIQDQWIDLRLPDQTRLRGRALRVTPEALVMDVRRSSNHALHPHGRAEIPRAWVSKLDVMVLMEPDPSAHSGGVWGAVVGAVLSQGPGLVLEQDGHPAASGVVVVAMIVGGAYLGHRLFDRNEDRQPGRRRTVVIVDGPGAQSVTVPVSPFSSTTAVHFEEPAAPNNYRRQNPSE